MALIGGGYQGRILLNAAMAIGGVRFRAVCDIWKYAQNYGQNFLQRYEQEVQVYEDFREMLDKERELDAVLIATPDFAHATQVNACLEAGLHVYCEPMLAHNLRGGPLDGRDDAAHRQAAAGRAISGAAIRAIGMPSRS